MNNNTVETTLKRIEELINTGHFNGAIEKAVEFQALIPEIETLLCEMKKAEPTVEAYKKAARQALREKGSPTVKKPAPKKAEPKIQMANMPKMPKAKTVQKAATAAATTTNVAQKPSTAAAAPIVKTGGVISYIDKLLAPLKR